MERLYPPGKADRSLALRVFQQSQGQNLVIFCARRTRLSVSKRVVGGGERSSMIFVKRYDKVCRNQFRGVGCANVVLC